jgi:hypothetical protein
VVEPLPFLVFSVLSSFSEFFALNLNGIIQM